MDWREWFDGAHSRLTADGAEEWMDAGELLESLLPTSRFRLRRRWTRKDTPAQRDHPLAMTVGEKPEVADTDEAIWEAVEQRRCRSGSLRDAACGKIRLRMAPHPQRTDPDGVTFRPLASLPDYEACIELQRLTWGREFSDAVPLSILKVTQKAGGIAAGAFSADGRLRGFVYGLAGYENGRLFHWSHMLAVHPEARDLGVGTRLKLYQREVLLSAGIEEVRWTYDPLEARNAHLNLNHLGAEVAEYVEDMYEGEMGSDLAKGIGTDRFILSWRIAGDRVARALADHRRGEADRFRDAPVVNPGAQLLNAPRVRIEIPVNIQAVKAEQSEKALAWRTSTRQAFETYLSRGYTVEAFYRDAAEERCFYGLEKD